MANDQTTYKLKDTYFRTPTEGFTTRAVEAQATDEKVDGVKYKDKYFQGQFTTNKS